MPATDGEISRLLKLATPFVFSSISRNLHQFTDLAILGHFGTAELAAASLANVWLALVDVPMIAAVGQLSTVCGEAYGAGNFELVGTWLKIMLLIIFIGSLPMLVGRWYTAQILTKCGFEAGLAAQSGVYAKWLQFSSIVDLVYTALREYMAVQDITTPAVVTDAVFVLVNFGLNYLCVFSLGLGLQGSAMATTFTRIGLCATFFVYCFKVKKYHRRTWQCRCKDALVRSRWVAFIALIVPAALGTLAEELQFQLMSILAGRMGDAVIAAHNLLLTILMICWVFAEGLGQAAGIRVATHLGAGEARLAKYVANVSLAITILVGVAIGLLLLLGGPVLDYIVTSDDVVREQLQRMRFLVAGCIAALLGFSTVYVVLLKQGRGSIPSIVIPVCCWLIGCPTSIYLGLSKGMGLVGLWSGLLCGYGLALLVLLYPFAKSDWEAIALSSQTRAEVATTFTEDLVQTSLPQLS